MIINQDLVRIKKIAIFSMVSLFIIAIACYFVFPQEFSFAVIISEVLAFIIFIFTLFFYYWLSRRKSLKMLKYVFFSFFGKIIFLGFVFYLMFILDFINLLTFAVSFIIFFTIFFNIEIFFIYKKLLFKQ